MVLFLLCSNCFANCNTPSLQPIEKASQLLILVSFSMPEQSLKLWSEQASKVNGKLLLRGFVDNSIQKTTEKILQLFGEQDQGELLVDPESFEKYNIQTVPAVVIMKPNNCFDEHCSTPKFDVIYGDISLEDALKAVNTKGSEEGKRIASRLLQQYRGSND